MGFTTFILGLAGGMYISSKYDMQKLHKVLKHRWGTTWKAVREEITELERSVRKDTIPKEE